MALSDFSGFIPLFFEGFLSKPASSLPKGAQWVIDFEGLQDVKSAILRTAALEPRRWEIEDALNLLTAKGDYNNKGLLFAQAVNIPGESTIANPEGIQKNHYIQTTTGDGRSPYASNALNVAFLDTNVNFVENVIRPWVITTARLGLIARPPGPTNYRQDISFYKIGVLTPSQPPFILSKHTFFGACPIEVGSEEYNYSPTTNPINRDVTFLYHYYRVEVPKNSAITYNNSNIPVVKATKNSAVSQVVSPSR